jgi:hypothetical protein
VNIIKSSATSAALSLMLVVSSLSAQTVTDHLIRDIENNADGTDPFAGGARVTHTVNSGAATNVRDFHVCVGETNIRDDEDCDMRDCFSERKVEGDPHNGNYRAGPDVPAGWSYRGVQRGATDIEGKTTWCVTWVRTAAGGAAPDTPLSFTYDYKGPSSRLKEQYGSAVFTSDGNTSAADAVIGDRQPGVTPLSMSEPSDEPRPAFTLWLALGVLAVVLLFMFAFKRRGANKRDTNTTHDSR